MESILKIHNFARGVMWRRRLLTLQDTLALGLLVGGLISAALIFYIRWKAIQTPVWVIALVVFSAVFGALLTRWSMSRSSEKDAGFLIDDALNLEDRFATSQAIIGKSKVESEVEKALIEDASGRVADVKTSAIVPYRMKKFYALSAAALLAFGAAIMVPQKSLPGGAEMIQTQADIQTAGEQLEKTSTEIEKFVPPETVTAGLAKEQADLGRSLRRSSDTRAEALKKLSSLENRIRERHDELKNTRADEIVALAQKRMGTALAQMGNRNIQQSPSEKEQASDSQSTDNVASRESKANQKKASTENAGNKEVGNKIANDSSTDAKVNGKDRQSEKSSAKKSAIAKANQNSGDKNKEEDKQQKETVAKQKQPEQKNTGEKSERNQIAENQKRESEKNSTPQKPNPTETQNGNPESIQQPDVKKNTSPENPEVGKEQSANKQPQGNSGQPDAKTPEQEQEENKEQEQNKDASNPLTTAVAEQTAKALPLLSEQLLKKAEDLKLGKMSAEDIKKLAQSATQLAKDLAPIAQSKEFQKTLEQLAKQVNPQQLEQIARELMKDEKLQRELQAAAKLLWENRQVKDMVAGLTKTAAQIEAEMRPQGGENKANQSPDAMPNQQSEPITLNSKSNTKGQQKGSSTQGTQTDRAEGERKLAGQGREAKISGQLQNRPGGDYVYSGVKPGVGATRVPYSSAYPQYRRQAERTVERSQVPTHMRSMIRSYFDAINPNGKN